MTGTSHGDGAIGPDRDNERLAGEGVAKVRSQLAVARALLAELDRELPAGTTSIDEQLACELRRLGGLLVELARPFGSEGVAPPLPRRPRLVLAVPRAELSVRVRQVGRRA